MNIQEKVAARKLELKKLAQEEKRERQTSAKRRKDVAHDHEIQSKLRQFEYRNAIESQRKVKQEDQRAEEERAFIEIGEARRKRLLKFATINKFEK